MLALASKGGELNILALERENIDLLVITNNNQRHVGLKRKKKVNLHTCTIIHRFFADQRSQKWRQKQGKNLTVTCKVNHNFF